MHCTPSLASPTRILAGQWQQSPLRRELCQGVPHWLGHNQDPDEIPKVTWWGTKPGHWRGLSPWQRRVRTWPKSRSCSQHNSHQTKQLQWQRGWSGSAWREHGVTRAGRPHLTMGCTVPTQRGKSAESTGGGGIHQKLSLRNALVKERLKGLMRFLLFEVVKGLMRFLLFDLVSGRGQTPEMWRSSLWFGFEVQSMTTSVQLSLFFMSPL